jgi:uncharacterized membrane protein YqjE
MSSARSRLRGFLPSDGLFAPLAAVVVLISALVPLAFDRRHYFVDDSVNGAFGQWYHLGHSLLDGRLPFLEPSAWSSGNLFAEGQWGFFNPLILVISMAAATASDAAVFATSVKILAIVIGGVGVYVLAREFGARPPFAFLAATLAPFSGFTTYFDAPSWVTGLFAWSLIPWFWAATARLARGRGNPLPAYIAGYLIVSIGYVHGTIAVVILLASSLAVWTVRRSWSAVRRVMILSILLGLVAVAVHVTSLMTASVTNRGGSSIYMDQFMTLDLSGLAMGPIPTALPQAAAWWWTGLTSPVPLGYLAWVLPLAALVQWRRLFRVDRRLIEAAVAGGAFFVFIMLPTVIGPLRYPTRMLPYVALCALVVLAVGLDRARSVTRSRVIVVVAFFGLAFLLTWAQTPQYLRRHLAAAALVAIGALAVIWLLRRSRKQGLALVAVFAATGIAALGLQTWAYPRPVWPSQGVPTAIPELQVQAHAAEGDTIVIGNPLEFSGDSGIWKETLFANSWYVNPAAVVNRYQLLGFVGLNGALCMGYSGETCPELAESLFEVRPATGLSLADEMAISSVQIIKTASTEQYLNDPPPGWHVADDGTLTQTWVRDVVVPVQAASSRRAG